jgi:FkbM family methyltransferase
MSKYFFTVDNQSNWIVDIYNKFIPFKNDGFIVEIGVGHTFSGVDNILPSNVDSLQRCGSNSSDLLDLGWSGILIEPVLEYCEEAKIAHEKNLDRVKIVNFGASDSEGEVFLSLGDALSNTHSHSPRYPWIGRKVAIKETSKILGENGCPKEIDIMSIDVEGHELNVINGIDFTKHSPHIIIVETNIIPSIEISQILPNNYIQEKTDGLNTVWVRI